MDSMKRSALVPVGLVLVLLGVVWALQGLDVLGGSAMSGKVLWAVVGPIVALAGLVLVLLGVRRKDRAEP
jgi:hypothetical protein